MTKSEVESILNCLKNKTLLNLIYRDKTEDSEDSCLELIFSHSYKLEIQTFWRIFDETSILAMDTDRYLLPDNNAPEKDYQRLPINKSLLYKNLEFLKTKIINSIVEDVVISETKDIRIKFDNSLMIQGIINCRCNSYMYYGLYYGDQEILKVCFDWSLCE